MLPRMPIEESPPKIGVSGAYYAVAHSGDLQSKPKAVDLFGIPLVLFRHGGGVAALEDRCPHRNVPLSGGKTDGHRLECPYHGWQFGPSGACEHIPGLCQPQPKVKRTLSTVPNVPSYPVREASGYIWVWADPNSSPGQEEPLAFPHLQTPGYSTIRQCLTLSGSIHSVAENALDVPHTAFLHGGLFRSDGERQAIEVQVRRSPRGVEAQYIGESRPEGLIGKLLAPSGGEVEHWDRFFLPGIAQVEYRLGEDAHLIATTALTPIGKGQLKLWGTVTYRLQRMPRPLARIAGELLKPLALVILRQDARILAAQSETIERFGGPSFSSTEIDVLGPSIAKLLRSAESLGTLPEEGPMKHHRTLRMSV